MLFERRHLIGLLQMPVDPANRPGLLFGERVKKQRFLVRIDSAPFCATETSVARCLGSETGNQDFHPAIAERKAAHSIVGLKPVFGCIHVGYDTV